MTNKYNHSKIYKIISDNSDRIYIGSTTLPLPKRLASHKYDYTDHLNNPRENKGLVSSFNILSLDNVSIILLEEVNCENKEQLRARERHYIDLHRDVCVNKARPVITNEERTIYKAEWNKKTYVPKPPRKIYTPEERKEANRKKCLAYQQRNKHIMILCDCGIEYSKSYKSNHIKTKGHLAFQNSKV